MGEIRERILLRLMHEPRLGFSELWDKSVDSNKFAYHLKSLEEQKMIRKVDGKYELTFKGRQNAGWLDGETGKAKQYPIFCVLIMPIEGDKILLQERLREPIYGYWGIVGGRIESGRNLTETLDHELEEEAGLKGEFEVKGLFVVKTFEKQRLAYTHYHILVKAFNVKGKLKSEIKEGKNKWFKVTDVPKLKIFPDMPKLIEMAQRKRFSIVEMNRYMENKEFKRIEIVNEVIL